MMCDALTLVRSVMAPTPLQRSELDPRVLLKREDMGPNRSFKWRGALAALTEFGRGGASAVATASTGNHGVAVAWAAARLGMSARVVVPVDAISAKCAMIRQHGARLYRQGDSLSEAMGHARDLADELGIPLFEDGASQTQMLGAATIGHELLDQTTLDTVLVPVACGALAGGIGLALSSRRDRPRLIGVQSVHFSRLTATLQGRHYLPSGQPTIADGLADDRVVEPAYSYCRRYLDDVLTVDDHQLEAAMADLCGSDGVRAEAAAAAPLAALRSLGRSAGSRVALVISGGNVAPELAARVFGSQGGAAHLRG